MQQSNSKKMFEDHSSATWSIKYSIIQTKKHFSPICSRIILTVHSVKSRKAMIHEIDNVEYFEMFEVSPKVQCTYCLKYWTIGIVYCTCATCLFLCEQIRKLNQDKFDTPSIHIYVIVKGPDHGVHCGQSEEQQAYHKAHEALKKAKKKVFYNSSEIPGIW